MSKIITGVLGAAALVVSLGAAQLAVGHDLSGSNAEVAIGNQVNRTAKADRVGAATVMASKVVTQNGDTPATSLVVRVPRSILQPGNRAIAKISGRPVACEAPASVLTEIAKQMESGRCVT